MSEISCCVTALVAKEGMFPFPLESRPVFTLVFVQAKLVAVSGLVKLI